jgi:hypothetical protein
MLKSSSILCKLLDLMQTQIFFFNRVVLIQAFNRVVAIHVIKVAERPIFW